MSKNKNNKSKNNLSDPVDDSPIVEMDQQEEMMSMSLNKTVTAKSPKEEMEEDSANWISMGDVQEIREESVRTPHPFAGYPLAPKVKIGYDKVKKEDVMISRTFIVLVNPTFAQVEDPSNRSVSIYKDVADRPGKGGKPGSGTVEKIVKLKTAHTRCVQDRFGVNHSVVFDRDIMVRGGGRKPIVYQGAIIKEHSVRAQIMYYYDPDRKRVRTDKRYKLVDIDQQKRLLRLFESLHYQQTKAEHRARELERIPETTDSDR